MDDQADRSARFLVITARAGGATLPQTGNRAGCAAGHWLDTARPRGWLSDGLRLTDLAPPDGDPDRLLVSPGCRLIKDQTKVKVGMVDAAGIGPTYVKRYNAFSWRVRLSSLFVRSPALRALDGTRLLAEAGFRAAVPLAALEYRRWWLVEKSFFLTAEVTGAVPADQFWWDARGKSPRRALIAGLAGLFADLHRAGIYHGDLKDANVLVRREGDRIAYYLLDLEHVRRRRTLPSRRRIKNLVQLHRTLGRLATARENLLFLRAYLGDEGRSRSIRRTWWRRVCAAVRRKDLRHALRGTG